jgi:hypothetical protein
MMYCKKDDFVATAVLHDDEVEVKRYSASSPKLISLN